MKRTINQHAIKAIEMLGGSLSLAMRLNVTQSYVNMWKYRGIPPRMAIWVGNQTGINPDLLINDKKDV